ncbi:MAG TPA: hypothetical protein VNH53_03875 [Sphingomicrobium sp.]|nr:hypothetical protein [Sphingomicrobium sp.]
MRQEHERARPKRGRDSRSPLQRAADERAEASRAAWARRHPEAAAAERALRRANAKIRQQWKHKNEGTPETHEHASRRNQGALARLYKSGAINAEQLAAAVEIAAVVERIGADVSVRTASLETRVDVDRHGDGSFYERLGQVRREIAYSRWREQVRAMGPIAAVLDMVAGEPAGFTVVARRYGMHNRRAKRLLIDALDLWPALLWAARREVDEKALDQAHARLAA